MTHWVEDSPEKYLWRRLQVNEQMNLEKKKVEKQLASPGADVQAEVKMSYERYMQIGYKELECLTHENYSLSGSADLASVANVFNPIFYIFVFRGCLEAVFVKHLSSCFCETPVPGVKNEELLLQVHKRKSGALRSKQQWPKGF